VPTVVANLFDVVQIAPGEFYNAAVLGDGTVRYWLLGPTIYQVPGLTNVKKIGVGEAFKCVLLGDGTVSCWGINGYEGGRIQSAARPTSSPTPSRCA
jgi:alpha-tubulin suppressor-like RCC1 family protein